MRQKISARVDVGTSGHDKRAQTGSEDPHWRERKFLLVYGGIHISHDTNLYLEVCPSSLYQMAVTIHTQISVPLQKLFNKILGTISEPSWSPLKLKGSKILPISHICRSRMHQKFGPCAEFCKRKLGL